MATASATGAGAGRVLARVDRAASSKNGVILALLSALAVGAWAAHVFATAGLARLRESHPGVEWVMHGATLLTALPCLLAIAVGAWHAKRLRGEEGDGTPQGRTIFLAWMTIVTGAFNLVLIVAEDVFITLVHGHV